MMAASPGIQAYLSPLGARALLGVPAGHLAGLDLPASDLLGPLRAAATSPRWTMRCELVCAARHPAAPSPEVAWAWQQPPAQAGGFPSHLDRDFRLLADGSPTGWLASEFRFVQAGLTGLVAV